MSTLSSVVGSNPDRLAEWRSMAVREDEQPACFHTKFWGQSMDIEEQAWHNAQLNMADEHQGGDEPMSESGEADDMISGCYALDIDIEGCPYRSIWIRAEYIRTYDFLEKFRRDIITDKGPAPAAILTGQSGIGKSLWIYYALRRRLAERQPVIWYFQQTCYLFVEEGVYEKPPTFKPAQFRNFPWTLVDSDEAKDGIPPYLVVRNTGLCVIYVTFLAEDRWSRMHKTVQPTVVIMNSWTKQEIHRAAPLRLPSPDFKVIDDVYDKYGPIPRLCFDQASQPRMWAAYLKGLREALATLTLQKLEQVVVEGGALTMNSISDKICLLQRDGPIDTLSDPQVLPMTDFIRSQITICLRNHQRREHIRVYRQFSVTPGARGMTGNIFEAYGHLVFQQKISINYLAMVRLPDQKVPDDETQARIQQRHRWHSSYGPLGDKTLEALRQDALSTQLSLNVSPSSTCEYGEDDIQEQIEPDVYYIPRSANQVAFDSFILHDGYLYVFQFTAAQTHQIKFGLITFLTRCANLPEPDKWRFIFILPDVVEVLRCPYPQRAELQKLKLYSSILTMETMQQADELEAVEVAKRKRKSRMSRRAIGAKNDKEGAPAPAKRLRRSGRFIGKTAAMEEDDGSGEAWFSAKGQPTAGPSRLR